MGHDVSPPNCRKVSDAAEGGRPVDAMSFGEDETIVRMTVADMLEQLGHAVVAEAASINSALKIADTAEFDIAILDINIAGHRIDPVAELIDERDIPFVFASGYGRAENRKSTATVL